jgi:cell division protein FtsA
MKEHEEIIAGLDIGTTKVAAIVGRKDSDGHIDVLGFAHAPSKGMRRGIVINIPETVNSIKAAITEAELVSGHKIKRVFAGIAGDHVRSSFSKGVIGVKNKTITEEDVERVINAAKTIALPRDREIIHILPQEYIIDNQGGINEPVGVSATHLEVKTHIVTAAITSAQNIRNSIAEAGCEVEELVLEPYASSLAVLNKDEMEMGTCLVDIGGGTTDIAIFFDGSIHYTTVIGVGGEHVTRDLLQGLRTSFEQAEHIKKEHGVALQSLLTEEELVTVPGVGNRASREISKQVIAAIIQARMEELFRIVVAEMEKSMLYEAVSAGIVLTGGASQLAGAAELAEKISGLPVKIGEPMLTGGLTDAIKSPKHATGVGLLYYGANRTDNLYLHEKGDTKFGNYVRKIKDIVDGLFG